jgi:hypothetical protein
MQQISSFDYSSAWKILNLKKFDSTDLYHFDHSWKCVLQSAKRKQRQEKLLSPEPAFSFLFFKSFQSSTQMTKVLVNLHQKVRKNGEKDVKLRHRKLRKLHE